MEIDMFEGAPDRHERLVNAIHTMAGTRRLRIAAMGRTMASLDKPVSARTPRDRHDIETFIEPYFLLPQSILFVRQELPFTSLSQAEPGKVAKHHRLFACMLSFGSVIPLQPGHLAKLYHAEPIFREDFATTDKPLFGVLGPELGLQAAHESAV